MMRTETWRPVWMVVLGLGALCTEAIGSPVLADDKVEIASDLAAWLEKSWDNSSASKADLDRLAKALAPSPQGWNEYALGVAFLKQRDYRRAVEHFESAHRLDTDNRRFLRALIFGKVLTREPRSATARLAAFAESLRRESATDPAMPIRDDLEFLAVIVGFLQLPTTTGINAGELDRQLARIQASLSEKQQAEFDETVASVRRLHDSLMLEKGVEREIATEAAEVERVEQLEMLGQERVRLAESVGELEPRIAQVREERADALAEIRDRDAPLAQDMASLVGQLAALDRELWDIDRQIAALLWAQRGDRDRGARRFWRWEIDRLLLIASDIQADRAAVQAQAAVVANQRLALQQEYALTQAEYDRALGELDADWQQLRRLQKVNEVKTQRQQKPAKASSGKAQAFAREARTLSTYYEFPVESERLWLIDSAAGAHLSDETAVKVDAGDSDPEAPKPGGSDELILGRRPDAAKDK